MKGDRPVDQAPPRLDTLALEYAEELFSRGNPIFLILIAAAAGHAIFSMVSEGRSWLYPFTPVLMAALLLTYLAFLKRRKARMHGVALFTFALATLPSLRVVLSFGLDDKDIPASFFFSPDNLVWTTLIISSGLLLNRRLIYALTLWCVLQNTFVFFIVRATLLGLKEGAPLIEPLISFDHLVGRTLSLLSIGWIMGLIIDLTKKIIAQLHREEFLRMEVEVERQLAERESQTKSVFMAHVNHELRTPLNAILGYTQLLLKRQELTAPMREEMRLILDSGEHLKGLIEDALDMSRIDALKMDIFPTAVRLTALIDLVVRPLGARAEHKGVELRLSLDPRLPEIVLVDQKRLRQVLFNLLGNAIKFTHEGHVGLDVSLSDDPGPPGCVKIRFTVEDTGVGIAPQDIDTIFDPFSQSGDLHQRQAGAGLGLSISVELIKLMGGDIKVRSGLGEGSAFWFELALPPVSAVLGERLDRAILGFKGAQRQILVADDHPLNRDILAEMLGRLGFEVRLACDGQEALESCLRQRPDLILLDLLMPNLNGVEAATAIRASCAGAPLPILAITASAMLLGECTWEKSLFDGLLQKPVSFPILLDEIQRHLDLEWIIEEPPEPPRPSPPPLGSHTPPLESLDALRELALLGNLLQADAMIGELLAKDDNLEPFASVARQMIRDFDDKALLNLLDGLRDTPPTPPKSNKNDNP